MDVVVAADARATRRCSKCREVKTIADFPLKNRACGLRRVWCRDCCRAYGREHYRKNRSAYLAKSARRRQVERPRVRALIDRYLRQHPCVDCGCSDITVLEFDHRDRFVKEFTVGELARVAEWPRVLHEIEKCDVRCANCHRVRTAKQFSWAKEAGIVVDPAVIRPGQTGRYRRLEKPAQDPLFTAAEDGLRRCSRCGERRPIFAFPFRNFNAGERAYYCRACQAAYRHGHYVANRGDYMTRAMTEAQLKREDMLLRVFEYLRQHPCVDCGETDIRKLEFDHRDRSTKTMAVTSMIGRRTWEAIQHEIAKCDVRCANCHRKRTAEQQAWKCRLAEARAKYGRLTSSRVWRSGNAERSQRSVTSSILVTRSVLVTPR